jgi:hypothetical protein
MARTTGQASGWLEVLAPGSHRPLRRFPVLLSTADRRSRRTIAPGRDGPLHQEEEQAAKDRKRDLYLRDAGFRVERFAAEDALANIIERIRRVLSETPSPGARASANATLPARREGKPGPHIVAPICQGTNSLSPKPSISLFDLSPDATARIFAKISSPFDSIVASPSTMSPQFMSMSSSIVW